MTWFAVMVYRLDTMSEGQQRADTAWQTLHLRWEDEDNEWDSDESLSI